MLDPVVGRVPFTEAIDHFKNKKVLTSRRWDDMVAGEHAKVFTVAGVTKIEMTNDIYRSMNEIRARGGSFDEFKRSFKDIIRTNGWEYDGDINRRAKLIFETNIRTSNAAGTLAKARRRQANLRKRNPDAVLYMAYRVLDNSLRRRKQHQAWQTIVLPVDHSWWDTHFPPNGFGCACYVVVLTLRQLKRAKLEVTNNPPPLNRTERINKGTGEIYPPTPEGIDVGFDHNHVDSGYFPTGGNIVNNSLGNKLSQLTVDSPDFARLVDGELDNVATIGFLPEGLPELIGATTHRVFLSSETIKKQIDRHPEIGLDDYRNLPSIFRNGLIIQDSGQTFVFIYVGSTIYRAAVKSTNDGTELYLTSLITTKQREIDRMRKRGEVIREQL